MVKIRSGSRVWFKVKGKQIRGVVGKTFKGIYYKGRKKIGLRTFVEVRVGKKNFILTLQEFRRRTKRRIL